MPGLEGTHLCWLHHNLYGPDGGDLGILQANDILNYLPKLVLSLVYLVYWIK